MIQVVPLCDIVSPLKVRHKRNIYLAQSFCHLTLVGHVTAIERDIVVALDNVKDRDVVSPVEQLLYDVTAQEAIAANNHKNVFAWHRWNEERSVSASGAASNDIFWFAELGNVIGPTRDALLVTCT